MRARNLSPLHIETESGRDELAEPGFFEPSKNQGKGKGKAITLQAQSLQRLNLPL